MVCRCQDSLHNHDTTHDSRLVAHFERHYLDGSNSALEQGLSRDQVWGFKNTLLKAFQSLKECLDYSTITPARFALSRNYIT